jgi:hypothetical protein
MSRFVSVLAVGLTLAFTSTAFAASNSAFLGTWKLNLAKSKSSAALPLSGTYVVEAAGEGIKSTQDMVSDKGVKNHGTYTANFDGKTYPNVGSGPLSSIALTRVNANSYTSVRKAKTFTRNGTTVISADGKTRTTKSIDKNADGTTVTRTSVYDKQ